MQTHAQMDDSTLFDRYLEICNQALLLNKDRFPFKQILGAGAKAGQNHLYDVRIENALEKGCFSMMLHDGRLQAQAMQDKGCAGCCCSDKWRVTRQYLEEVVSRPDEYIVNPAKLDWGWMIQNGAKS